MRRKSLRILMLAFMSLWYGVIVPGHQRGVIQLPGAACCRQKADTRDNSRTPADPAGNCAVCYTFTVTIELPTSIQFVPAPASLIAELTPPPLQSLEGVAHLIDARGRGPPTVPMI